jgi:hypothetical protein
MLYYRVNCKSGSRATTNTLLRTANVIPCYHHSRLTLQQKVLPRTLTFSKVLRINR